MKSDFLQWSEALENQGHPESPWESVGLRAFERESFRYDAGHGIILTNERGKASGEYVLLIPEAKKLAGAVEHAVKSSEAMP